MEIKINHSLIKNNTFKIDVKCSAFVELCNLEDIREFINYKSESNSKKLIIGGGSNILFTKNFEGTVAQIKTKGIKIINESPKFVHLKVEAGELWSDLIDYCIQNEYYGLENLTGIPGMVGSSPVQNIGAYGSEVKDCIVDVETIDISNGEIKIFSNPECKFNYRDSIFKNQLKDKVVILSVTYRLSKEPQFNLNYKDVDKKVKELNQTNYTIKGISEIILALRNSKLPDLEQIGNAGSFFKNPIIEISQFIKLFNQYPQIHYFSNTLNSYKIAAAWLIENAGFKGKTVNQAGVYPKNSLVLVNYNNASGKEILELANSIKTGVLKKFGIKLEFEVNIF